MIHDRDYRDSIFDLTRGHTPTRRKTYDIFSAQVGREKRAYILSPRVIGCYTHFIAGPQPKSKPCLQTPGCPWCKDKAPKREKGYLAGMDFLSGRQVLVELTKGAYESCPLLLKDAGNLRGRIIVFGRRGTAVNAPVWARLETEVSKQTVAMLPPEFDVIGALWRLWEMDEDDGSASSADLWDGSPPQPMPAMRSER